jgi:hypothetical protein
MGGPVASDAMRAHCNALSFFWAWDNVSEVEEPFGGLPLLVPATVR